jgi:hypothetical protein
LNCRVSTNVPVEKVIETVFEAPNEAVPDGTVAGIQFEAVLKSSRTGIEGPGRILSACRSCKKPNAAK